MLTVATFGAAFLASDVQAQITIAQAKQQALGTVVSKIAGRVTVAGQFRNTAYLQDATGGIAVFNTQFRTGVQVGDSVIIENATLAEFQPSSGQPGTGLTQLTGNDMSFTVVPTAKVEPLPRNINILSIGESAEGELVRIRGVKFVQTGAFQGETTYQIKNKSGQQIDLRLDGATEIATNQLLIPTEEIDVVGVISQFRGNYQIVPRFARDLSLAFQEDTVSKSRTLDVTTWNLYWFGSADTSVGVDNKEFQYRNIVRAMDSIDADLYALQEVSGESYFNRLRDTLGYGGIMANAILQDQKTAYLYNKSVIDTISSGLAVNGGGQAWGNGRFPFRLDFRATINGISQDFSAFVIHGKATGEGTEVEDRQRRETDANTFREYLNSFYGDKNVIVLGDFNDDVTKSVVKNPTDTTQFLPSPYKAFVDDTENFTVVTKFLSEQNISTYLRFDRGTLDHIIISNELRNDFYRAYVEPVQAFLSSFTTTVSDHLPVTARFYVTGTGTSVEDFKNSSDFSVRVNSQILSQNGMIEFTQMTPGNVRITLVNALGAHVAEIINGNFAEGIQVRQLDVAPLSSGAYYLQVQKGASMQVIPVVIAK
jgi:endonuclease/exonuclease/phosphatase family metal-dependent hydrolase